MVTMDVLLQKLIVTGAPFNKRHLTSHRSGCGGNTRDNWPWGRGRSSGNIVERSCGKGRVDIATHGEADVHVCRHADRHGRTHLGPIHRVCREVAGKCAPASNHLHPVRQRHGATALVASISARGQATPEIDHRRRVTGEGICRGRVESLANRYPRLCRRSLQTHHPRHNRSVTRQGLIRKIHCVTVGISVRVDTYSSPAHGERSVRETRTSCRTYSAYITV